MVLGGEDVTQVINPLFLPSVLMYRLKSRVVSYVLARLSCGHVDQSGLQSVTTTLGHVGWRGQSALNSR